MTVWGYSRCSTAESQGRQDAMRQVRELKAAGCTEIVYEYEHGDAAVKPQLDLLLERVQEGDTIITTEVSRLSRSVSQLCGIIDTIKEKKLCLQILGSITVDCRNGTLDPMSAAFVEMAAVFSSLELRMIRDRVRSGMERAREKGSPIGRPKITKENLPQQFYKYYPSYKSGSLNKSELARLCGLSRNTVRRYIDVVEGS